MSVLYLFHGHYVDDPSSLVGVLIRGIYGSPPWPKTVEIGEGINWQRFYVVEGISGEAIGVVMTEVEMQTRTSLLAKRRQQRQRQQQQRRGGDPKIIDLNFAKRQRGK